MNTIKSLYGTFNLAKFWLISGLITGVSALLLPGLLANIPTSSEPWDTLLLALLALIAAFGVCLFPFAIWQHLQRKRFLRWLEENWESLERGATHPDGYMIALDTKLVAYQAVFSAILATVSFESRPYVYEHRSAGAAQFSFTLLSAVFGWWFLGLDGVVKTVQVISNNTRSSKIFTLRDLVNGPSDQ